MKLSGQISAAIEVLTDITERHRPASVALSDWGRGHRFAGSRDRSVIGTLVYDSLRRRASLAWRMDSETPRALCLGVLRFVWGFSPEAISELCDGAQHAPLPLTDQEHLQLKADNENVVEMPDWVRADTPEWLFQELQRAFGEVAMAEGQALAERAPIDLRVNSLKVERARVLKAFQKYDAAPTPFSPAGVRIPSSNPQEKNPNVEAEAAHGKGWFELQDEASQIATFLSGAGPRLQVIDLCAGSGGKTLGLAALMQNTGQIYAYDSEKRRLRPIFERLKRAGARNVQILNAGDEASLAVLKDRMDVVFADAPCSGSGVWRRRPDAKWRLTPAALAGRIEDQRTVLNLAAPLVKPGGRLVYATCSVLPAENSEQTKWFLGQWPQFREFSWRKAWDSSPLGPAPSEQDRANALQLSPAKNGTDGFYISLFERTA